MVKELRAGFAEVRILKEIEGKELKVESLELKEERLGEKQ